MTTKLDAVLLDVRKAYRLLHEYQSAMFDLLAHIREQLRARPYSQEYILPRPAASLGAPENDPRSGMRYLPMFDLTAFWLRGESATAGGLMFVVWIQSDDGYDSDTFNYVEDAEVSHSQLIISVVMGDSSVSAEPDDLRAAWYSLPVYSKLMGKLKESETMPGYRAWTAAIDLADLGSREAIDSALDAWRSNASAALGHPV
ncbi:hypothetical protein ACX3YG_30055 [Pseudomonas wadenswilerensis]